MQKTGKNEATEDSLQNPQTQAADHHSSSTRSEGESDSSDDEIERQLDTDDASDGDSFQELPFRLHGITDRIDSLFSVAFKIRNPANRPLRPTTELYKHAPTSDLTEYMQERTGVETFIVQHMIKQHLSQLLASNQSSPDYEDFSVDDYCDEIEWLIQRTGEANARRRQQFVYWREHAQKLAAMPPARPLQYIEQRVVSLPMDETMTEAKTIPASAMFPEQSNVFSGPTTATFLDPQQIRLEDNVSIVSSVSRISTIRGVQGERLEWPSPPDDADKEPFFKCPYCKTICPKSYAEVRAWRYDKASLKSQASLMRFSQGSSCPRSSTVSLHLSFL